MLQTLRDHAQNQIAFRLPAPPISKKGPKSPPLLNLMQRLLRRPNSHTNRNQRQISVGIGERIALPLMQTNKGCRLVLCLAAASAATISNFVFSAHAQQVRGFSADLSFTFHCSGDASQDPVEAIERFLRQKGFKVLNVVRLLRERKLSPLFSDLMINGVDESQHQMVRFMSTPFQIGWYEV
jgi:hypothetical protein